MAPIRPLLPSTADEQAASLRDVAYRGFLYGVHLVFSCSLSCPEVPTLPDFFTPNYSSWRVVYSIVVVPLSGNGSSGHPQISSRSGCVDLRSLLFRLLSEWPLVTTEITDLESIPANSLDIYNAHLAADLGHFSWISYASSLFADGATTSLDGSSTITDEDFEYELDELNSDTECDSGLEMKPMTTAQGQPTQPINSSTYVKKQKTTPVVSVKPAVLKKIETKPLSKSTNVVASSSTSSVTSSATTFGEVALRNVKRPTSFVKEVTKPQSASSKVVFAFHHILLTLCK